MWMKEHGCWSRNNIWGDDQWWRTVAFYFSCPFTITSIDSSWYRVCHKNSPRRYWKIKQYYKCIRMDKLPNINAQDTVELRLGS